MGLRKLELIPTTSNFARTWTPLDKSLGHGMVLYWYGLAPRRIWAHTFDSYSGIVSDPCAYGYVFQCSAMGWFNWVASV
jgi:hypothetical protein